MFRTTEVRFMWRVFSALSLLSSAVLLGACTHAPTLDSGEPESWVVESVVSKSTADLYAELVKPAVFERSNSKVINGYTIESGKLRMPDNSEGALVTVRSPDGGLTAFINKPGKSGSLYVDSKGVSSFIPLSIAESDIEDAVPNPDEKVATASVKSAVTESYVVDLFMGYSKSGVDRAGGDAMRDALAKVEFLNLALRNSLVPNVSFKLVGIQIVEPDYQVTDETLNRLPTIFSEGIASTDPDMFYGNFGSFSPGGPAGLAWMPGRYGIAISHDFYVFAHEMGHSAGSHHCNDGTNNYRFGYFNGKSGSFYVAETGKLIIRILCSKTNTACHEEML
ncbi:M12 family metallo-peptidase [Pseudomonas putida]|uniref:M12 family metallo-peptidase n=1 Tax=Pseudomonas putida TaxID=303 RepID=UPI003D9963E6